jgi:tetratricopeptide (TPR) repeat protein
MIRILLRTCSILMLGFSVSAPAALTEAEKQLLLSGMSTAAAEELGKTADAAGLERIVAIGDPNLVAAFSTGLARARIELMPPAIEALVLKHFDNPQVGEAMRRVPPRYQTRALFDRYYAVAKAAYRSNDPVFEQILRTDQPGIDDALLQIAPRFPTRPGADLNPVIAYVGRRKHPGAVEPLFAALDSSFANNAQYNTPFNLLLDYESPDIWRRVGTVLDRIERDKGDSEQALSRYRRQLNVQLSDPEGYLARKRGAGTRVEFARKRQALTPLANSANAVRSEPRRYVEEQAKYLAAVEAIAAEFHADDIDYTVAGEYSALGVFARFQAHDAALAIRFLEKGAKGRAALGQIALADTYEFELRDKAAAIRAYQAALDTASQSMPGITPYSIAGQAQNEFWKGWFNAEIEYLKTGQPFRGRIPEGAISGFWSLLPIWYNNGTGVVPGWPAVNRSVVISAPAYSGVGLNPRGTQAPDWPSIGNVYAATSMSDVPQKLAALPASRLTLFVTLKHISAMNDPALILKELARQDPSGYWTTIILGTVAFHEAHGRDGALADGVADALPGMAAPGRPNALARAADQYLKRRELRPVDNK